MEQLSTEPSSLLNNSRAVFAFHCRFKAWARWVYFSNKTKWHNERMELSWLYLIEFDQVPARCRSNLPQHCSLSPSETGEADKLWSLRWEPARCTLCIIHDPGTRASSNGLSFPFTLHHNGHMLHTLEEGIGESNLQLSLAKQEHIHTNRYIHR